MSLTITGSRRMGMKARTMRKAFVFLFGWNQPDALVGEDIEMTLLLDDMKNSPDFKPW